MGYALKSHEKLAHGIRRIARKLTSRIQKNLQPNASGHGLESFHEARTAVKRLRSLLRLVRKRLGKHSYRHENDALRAIAHSLSPLRDQHVLITTLRKLQRQFPNQISTEDYSRFRNALVKRHDQSKASATLKNLSKTRLPPLIQRLENWPLKGLSKRALHSAIKKSRRQFKRAYRTSKHDPTIPHLHEWRKRAKNLFYQLCLLERISPEACGKSVRRLKRLGKYLGQDHDLAMVGLAAKTLDVSLATKLQPLIHTCRVPLQRSAFKLGHKFAADEPV
jgi:CHAD domain-containing protein